MSAEIQQNSPLADLKRRRNELDWHGWICFHSLLVVDLKNKQTKKSPNIPRLKLVNHYFKGAMWSFVLNTDDFMSYSS